MERLTYLQHTASIGLAGVTSGVIAVMAGITSSDVMATIGIIGGAISIGLNMGLAWYHKIEKARRIEYVAWRRARVCPLKKAEEAVCARVFDDESEEDSVDGEDVHVKAK